MDRDAIRRQVRLEPDVYAELRQIKLFCEWPVSISTLASFAVRKGLAAARKTFNTPGTAPASVRKKHPKLEAPADQPATDATTEPAPSVETQ